MRPWQWPMLPMLLMTLMAEERALVGSLTSDRDGEYSWLSVCCILDRRASCSVWLIPRFGSRCFRVRYVSGAEEAKKEGLASLWLSSMTPPCRSAGSKLKRDLFKSHEDFQAERSRSTISCQEGKTCFDSQLILTSSTEDERDLRVSPKALSQKLVEVHRGQSPLYPPGAAPAGQVAAKPRQAARKEEVKVCEACQCIPRVTWQGRCSCPRGGLSMSPRLLARESTSLGLMEAYSGSLLLVSSTCCCAARMLVNLPCLRLLLPCAPADYTPPPLSLPLL
eukprot:37268-Hanusia_phi.AAC.1